MSDDPFIERLSQLFGEHGHRPYDGLRREPVTLLEHALQCGQLAEWADAPPTLVAAAVLHDIGHALTRQALQGDRVDDQHERTGAEWLGAFVGPDVTEPIRLHVDAKRYLVATDPGYAHGLSPASTHSLMLQGGPMMAGEVQRFEAIPWASDAIRLRRWDEAAKTPGRSTPTLAYYLALIGALREERRTGPRTHLGPLDVS